jgi:N-acetylneuraminic acid mutarotase
MPRLNPRPSAARTRTDGVRPRTYVLTSLVVIALACLIAGLAPFTSRAACAAARTLTLEERVSHQRAVEEVYWRHTVWPAENKSPKPSLDEVVPAEATRAKVEEMLRKSQALAQEWGRPVTPEQLQAEMTRMARETRRPGMLRELFAALGDDPFLIAEVLARPALVDRLARSSFDADAKAARTAAAESSFDSWWEGAGPQYAATAATDENFAYQLAEVNAAGTDDTWSPTHSLPVGNAAAVWTGTEVIVWGGLTSYGGRTDLGSRYNPATDTWTSVSTVNAPSERSGHAAFWTGKELLVWGGSTSSNNGSTNTGGRYNPQTDTWTPTSISGAPRSSGTTVWTGSNMVVLGGTTSITVAGAIYDPSTDTWKAIPATNPPSSYTGTRVVWTGKEIFFWGGINNTTGKRGGLYNPATNTWRQPNNFNAPSERNNFTMVWTGKEVIVWGGFEGNTITLNTGGRYNPETDTWTPTSTVGAADSRYGHTAVWTGTEMIVYGGDSRPNGTPDKMVNTGGRYNPETDSWTLTSTNGAPLKNNHTAVWTGSEMFVWGGRHVSPGIFREAARYRPSTDSWVPTNNQDSASGEVGVWTGAEMLVWGKKPPCSAGCEGTGGRYNPATNAWGPMSHTGAPAGDGVANSNAVWTGKEMFLLGRRYNPLTDTWTQASAVGAPADKSAAVWTGKEVLVWGGGATPENTPAPAGGRYNPENDTWRPMTTAGAPSARTLHSAVWTGSELVVWGGSGYFSNSGTNTGGRYNPETDTWRPTTTAGAPEVRLWNSAVWTGAELVVWGGSGSATDASRFLNTGARYNPVSDTWQPTSTDGAPQGRSHHRAVWTGSQMIVWGGLVPVVWTGGGDPVYTGARYNPLTDVWTPTSLQSPASRRHSHAQVWTGSQMIVFGGTGPSGAAKQDGAVYNAPGSTTPGNLPPTVSLTAPAGGTSYQSGDTVQLAAEVSDPDGAVTTVRFYANGQLVGTDTQAPFAFDWAEVRGGDYALTAAATDDGNAEGRSAAVNISVAPSNAPPLCVLTAPADGSNYAYGASVRMEATMTPNRDRAIARVEFLVDGRMVTYYEPPTYNPPYWHLYTANEAGERSLTARCTDNMGGVTTSAPSLINVAEQGFSISGQVLDARSNNLALAGIRLRLDGPAGTAPRYVTTTVAGNGNYHFGGLKDGETYTVTPENGEWKFSPASNTYTAISKSWSAEHFYGTRAGYAISGRLTDAGGNPISPATVSLSGSKVASTNVLSDGTYIFYNLAPGGTYTVQPNKNLYAFAPNFRTFENLSAEQTADFTGTPQTTTYAVGGRVVDDKGAPLAGLTVRLSTVRVSSMQTRTTDADGRFVFGTVQAGETCQVFPQDPTYTYNFSPASPRMYVGLAGDVSDANFVATPHSFSGRVVESGAGLAGVTVTLSGPQTATATTGGDGTFRISGVNLRGAYTVTAAKPGYALTPAAYDIKELQEDVTADFAAAALATPTPTPKPVEINNSGDFVAQHYRDFLGREADASGLTHWTNEIESCGADALCREVRRINVSAAFFLSIEFRNTGYLVERMYKAAFGDAVGVSTLGGAPAQIPVPVVRRSEFIADSGAIGNGVVVGRDGWERVLEANKNAFALAFVQRERFASRYPQAMTAGQFVDALFANARVTPTRAERDEALAAFGTGDAAGRAAALRSVAQSATFDAAEKNRAFVLMQFFGYLQRDPDSGRDVDHTGYQYWLDKLNHFNGNFVEAEMVKAFISSDEYLGRFRQ